MESIPELIAGLGIIGMLWKIQRELGYITTAIDSIKEIVHDHEDRLRSIEKKNK
jgi:hypothetical protein|tara:strand:+ start:4805 stop:4966 length:162 start_codon:yes stop_codon:yes gene_type:complete